MLVEGARFPVYRHYKGFVAHGLDDRSKVLGDVLGDAVRRHRGALAREGVTLGDEEQSRPSAAVVARLAAERYAAGERCELHALTPIYLRRPEAEEVWERTHGKS